MHAYSKTTGIAEAAINLPSRPDVYLRLIDAGGRRSERKKWIHVFHNISVVVFLVNLNGYNQTLAEDRRTVRSLSIVVVRSPLAEYQKTRRTVSWKT